MAASNWLWSWVWKSPLKGKLNDIEMHKLKVDATLGEGSFGVVTRLVDAKKKVYAGKKLREDVLSNRDSKKAILENFPDMSQQLCHVDHANILRMHGVFFSDSVSFLPTLVYEKADETLEGFLEVSPRASVPEADKLTILQDVANGLKHLHGQKPPIYHMNLTAANVFISHKPLTAKIADAGVASLMNAGLADCSRIAPRTRYHLPPKEDFLDSSASIDVFSYGVLIDRVLLQELNLKSVPIFRKGPGGDIVLDNADFARDHGIHLECLEIHPLYSTLQQCLMNHSTDRPLTAALSDQMCKQREKVLQWNEYIQKDAHKWIKDSNSLNIMITGKTGSGKTSLINGLVGKNVGEEGDGLTRGTLHVEPKKIATKGVAIVIWDTPGLQDRTGEEDRYLVEMKQHCSDCHLYIYCVSMNQKRNDDGEIRAMMKLTETFGKEFWKKVLFVLTFANTQEDVCPMDRDPTEWFESRVKLWRDVLSNTLTENCKVEKEIVNAIVVIPAGYSQPFRNKPDPWALPGITNWFHDFWKQCACAIDHHALPALLKANQHRFKKEDEITKEELKGLPIEEQPIPYSDAARMAGAGGLAVAGAAAGAGAGAGIGAALGGVIGALAGPPGVAAGAVAGGAIGAAVIDPIVIGLFWKYTRRKSSNQATK